LGVSLGVWGWIEVADVRVPDGVLGVHELKFVGEVVTIFDTQGTVGSLF